MTETLTVIRHGNSIGQKVIHISMFQPLRTNGTQLCLNCNKAQALKALYLFVSCSDTKNVLSLTIVNADISEKSPFICCTCKYKAFLKYVQIECDGGERDV